MGTQRPVVIGDASEDLGSPMAEHHGKKKEKTQTKKSKLESQIKAEKYKKEVVSEDVIEPKAEAEESLTKKIGKDSDSVKSKPKIKVGKSKIRSQKYKETLLMIDKKKTYSVNEALELVKKTSLTKFDGNIEVHIRLLSKSGKPEAFRKTLHYPHSTGKKIKVVILDESKIEDILKTKKTDFDLALATPGLMPKVAKLAKILGPKGKMPSPKAGTVTDKPLEVKKELESGLAEIKTDSSGIIHQVIGKVSINSNLLEQNFKTLVDILPKEKITSLYLCATMGPSIKVLTK